MYSGVTNTKASNWAIFAAQALVWGWWYWPRLGGSGSSSSGEIEIHQVDEFKRRVSPSPRYVIDPLGHGFTVPGTAENDGHVQHSGVFSLSCVTCAEPCPRTPAYRVVSESRMAMFQMSFEIS